MHHRAAPQAKARGAIQTCQRRPWRSRLSLPCESIVDGEQGGRGDRRLGEFLGHHVHPVGCRTPPQRVAGREPKAPSSQFLGWRAHEDRRGREAFAGNRAKGQERPVRPSIEACDSAKPWPGLGSWRSRACLRPAVMPSQLARGGRSCPDCRNSAAGPPGSERANVARECAAAPRSVTAAIELQDPQLAQWPQGVASWQCSAGSWSTPAFWFDIFALTTRVWDPGAAACCSTLSACTARPCPWGWAAATVGKTIDVATAAVAGTSTASRISSQKPISFMRQADIEVEVRIASKADLHVYTG